MNRVADWLGIHVDWAWYFFRLFLIVWPIFLLIVLPHLASYWPVLWQIAGWVSFGIGFLWPFRAGMPDVR